MSTQRGPPSHGRNRTVALTRTNYCYRTVPHRGLIGIEILLFIFFRLLAAPIAADTDADGTYPAPFLTGASSWQNGLRKGLAPLFWDATLPSTFFLILSGRVATLTFIERRNATSLAGAAFRRPFRFLLPVLVALAFTSVVSVAGGFAYAPRFAEATNNAIAQPPMIWDSFLEYLNTGFSLFFTVDPMTTNRGLAFLPPAGLSWFIPVVFQQSFTLYVFSVLLPFSTLKVKLWAFAVFIVVTYWLGTWAWYSLTGLEIAEMALVYLPLLPAAGIPLNRKASMHLPAWIVPSGFLALGVTLKYLWASIPERRNDEYIYHADMVTGTLNRNLDPATTPYPRVDDYLLATGAMVLLELSPRVQRAFDNPLLRYFARISFTLYLTAGTVCLSLGSYLYFYLTEQKGWTSEQNVLAVLFFACVPLSIAVAEIGHLLVEEPALWVARWLFKFAKEE